MLFRTNWQRYTATRVDSVDGLKVDTTISNGGDFIAGWGTLRLFARQEHRWIRRGTPADRCSPFVEDRPGLAVEILRYIALTLGSCGHFKARFGRSGVGSKAGGHERVAADRVPNQAVIGMCEVLLFFIAVALFLDDRRGN